VLSRDLSPRTFRVRGDGVELVGERWSGDPGRPTVVLLHGGGQTRHSWDRTAERLAAGGWPVVTLDLRGHGDSDWHPAGDYGLESFAADLLLFIAMLDRPPVVVGASLGGITALLAAGEHPGSVSALVLVDIVVQVEPAGVERIRSFLTAHRDGFASLEEVADAVEAYNPQRRRSRNLDGLRKNVRQHADGRWYWHWDPAFIVNDDEPRRKADPTLLARAAANLSIPTLLVRGLQSDVVSDAGMANMLELVPHAQTIEVGAAGHMVAGDDNDVFAGRLIAFLEEIETGPS
jgi:pimeloyl-ACP methyl ester carboxylesterase